MKEGGGGGGGGGVGFTICRPSLCPPVPSWSALTTETPSNPPSLCPPEAPGGQERASLQLKVSGRLSAALTACRKTWGVWGGVRAAGEASRGMEEALMWLSAGVSASRCVPLDFMSQQLFAVSFRGRRVTFSCRHLNDYMQENRFDFSFCKLRL